VKAAEAMQVVVEPAETSEIAEIAADVPVEGDLTQVLASEMSALEKKALVEKLNKQATSDRAKSMRDVFLQHGAGDKRQTLSIY
jgi:hypothetical protein